MQINKIWLLSCGTFLFCSGCDQKDKTDQAGKTEKIEDTSVAQQAAQKSAQQTAQPAVQQSQKSQNMAQGQDVKPSSSPDLSNSSSSSTSSDKKTGGSESEASSAVAASFSSGEAISQSEVIKRIGLLPNRVQKLPFSQLYTLVLFVMIQEKLSYQAALKEGFDKRPAMAKQLDQIKQNLSQKYYLEQKAKPSITEAAIEEQYKKLIKSFVPEDEVGLKHILVKTKEEADQIVKQITTENQSFEEVRKKKSQDRHTENGFLGYFRKSQLPKNQVDEIMGTPVDKIVNTPIAISKVGYSVLLVSDKRKSSPAPLAEVKDQVEAIFLRRASLEYMEGLHKTYKVKFFDPDGKERPHKSIDERLDNLMEKARTRKISEQDKQQEQSLNQLKDSSVIAKIGDQEIIFSEASNFIREHPGIFSVGMSPYDVYVTASEEIVNQRLIRSVLEKEPIDSNPDLQKDIQQATQALVAQRYLSSQAKKAVTDEQLHKAYDDLVMRMNTNDVEIKLRVIPVADMEAGRKAIGAIKSGKKFDEVFQEYCADEQFKAQKGDMGYLNKKDLTLLSSELCDKANRAAKATMITEPIDVNGRCLVVRVEDKRQIQVPQFKDIRSELQRQLAMEGSVKVSLRLIQQDGTKAWDVNGHPMSLDEKTLERSLGGAASAVMGSMRN